MDRPSSVRAWTAETVIGVSTCTVPREESRFETVHDVYNKNGALLLLDKIMYDIGETMTMHAQQQT